MPVARLAGEPPRAGNLFHHKPETGETFHKPVNPWGFADHFNRRVEFDPAFYDLFKGRRLLVEGQLSIKADTQPMPDHAPLEEKSPRVVALQLIKRARDIAYRNRTGRRQPPSVVLGAIALDAGPVRSRLIDEVIQIATFIRSGLLSKDGPRGTVQVLNPVYPPDDFTDRWPEDSAAQSLFDADLRRLIVDLYHLRNDNPGLEQKKEILKRHFGETAADYALESYLDSRRFEAEAGKLHMGARGRVMAGAAASVSVGSRATTAAKAATREGGGYLPE